MNKNEIASNAKYRNYLTSTDATQILNIRRETLYSYVSRGLVRSTNKIGSNEKLYLKEDILRLVQRAQARSGHGAIAASAMNWGEPILETSITEITNLGPCYRGILASELAKNHSFEQVAGLLWLGYIPEKDFLKFNLNIDSNLKKNISKELSFDKNFNFFERIAAIIIQQGSMENNNVHDLYSIECAMRALHMIVGCYGCLGTHSSYVCLDKNTGIVDGLLKALGIDYSDEILNIVNKSLIMLADHELSPATLVARVAASAGGSLHACISAAIGAASGIEVIQQYSRVEEFYKFENNSELLFSKSIKYHSEGKQIPGFNHQLYPQGDPRALLILNEIKKINEKSETSSILFFIDEFSKATGLYPRHELAIYLLCKTFNFPKLSAESLFILARTAGWIAHIREQRLQGKLLRPRAKFINNIDY